MKKTVITGAALLLALGLTSCAASTPPAENADGATTAAPAPAEPAEQVPGKGNISSSGVDFTTLTPEDLKLTTDLEYEFISSSGTTGTIEFVDSTDPRVADFEEHLQEAVGYHREYLIAEADNREGSEVANMYQVTIYDPEGLSYDFVKVHDHLSEGSPIMDMDYKYWSADGSKELTEAEYRALSDRGYELEEIATWAIDPLEKGTFILAMEIDEGALPEEITGVAVSAHGIWDTVQAYNPLISEYREWKQFQEAGQEWEAHKPEAEPASD